MLNKLPDELIRKIYKYVYSYVINQINFIKSKSEELSEVPWNHNGIQSTGLLEKMRGYNKDFKKLASDKGSIMLAEKFDPMLTYGLKNTNQVYKNPNLCNIYNYLTSKSGLMRYYVFSDYRRLARLDNPVINYV